MAARLPEMREAGVMGIIISSDLSIEGGMFPLPIKIELECDAATGFFCRGVASFSSPEGYVGAHSAAMAAGWLERQAPQGRLWLCPECSGKNLESC
jgi:hypothetical protein